MFKKIGSWFSGWTWKKVFKLIRKALLNFIIAKLLEFKDDIYSDREGIKKRIKESKNEIDTDKVLDNLFNKLDDRLAKLITDVKHKGELK